MSVKIQHDENVHGGACSQHCAQAKYEVSFIPEKFTVFIVFCSWNVCVNTDLSKAYCGETKRQN